MTQTLYSTFSFSFFNALLLIAMLSISTGTSAQNTYKCGNAYSSTPCPGGVTVDTQDTRTSAQKAQSEAATTKTAKSGDAMEKSRLTQERVEAKERAMAAGSGVSVVSAQSTAAETGDQSNKLNAAKKKNTPEFFTAQVPGEKKVKAKAKKETKKDTKKADKTKKLAAADQLPASVKP